MRERERLTVFGGNEFRVLFGGLAVLEIVAQGLDAAADARIPFIDLRLNRLLLPELVRTTQPRDAAPTITTRG